MKKGELTSTQIVTIILAIAAFVIVLIVVVSFKITPYTQEEVCHLSVLSRASVGSVTSAAQGFVPLKCTTKKICFSSGRERCKESFAGEDVDVVSLPDVKSRDDTKNIEKAARIIEETSAESMYKCWQMMGEGKLDLFGTYGTTRGLKASDTTCVICSRLAADKSVPHEVLNEVDVNEYMRTHVVPGSSLTYLQAFTDKGVAAPLPVEEDVYEQFLNEHKEYKAEGNLAFNEREITYVFMQIKSTEWKRALEALGKDTLIVAGTAFFAPGVKGITKKVFNIFTLKVKAAIGFIGVAAATGFTYYNTWVGQRNAAGACGKLQSAITDKEQEGCSVVEAVPYSQSNINALCSDIQGNP